MKWCFSGKDRRLELTIRLPKRDRSLPIFSVRFVPNCLTPESAFLPPSGSVYSGADGRSALRHMRLWAGVELVGIPSRVLRYLQAAPARTPKGARERRGR